MMLMTPRQTKRKDRVPTYSGQTECLISGFRTDIPQVAPCILGGVLPLLTIPDDKIWNWLTAPPNVGDH